MTIKTTTPLQSTQGETGLPRYFQAVFDQASRMEHGRLDMVLPDGRVFRAEGPKPGPVAELHIHNTDIFARLIREGDLGFCEAYLDEWWSTPDLQAFMDLVHADNEEVYDGFLGMRLVRAYEMLRFWLQSNSKRQAKKNISYHYDLGNEFYGLWLDDTMTYSSAKFDTGQESLEAAQTAEIRLHGRPDGRAARRSRAGDRLRLGRVRRIRRQGAGAEGHRPDHQPGSSMIRSGADRKAGPVGPGEIKLQDYRDERGDYDGIASIEMFEAVGEKYWPVYFETVRERLKPGQARRPCRSSPCRTGAGRSIARRRFHPEIHLPRRHAARAEGAARTGRESGARRRCDRSSSARATQTLRRWHETFNDRWDEVAKLGFDDRFRRMWDFYLCSCAAAFRFGVTDVTQITVRKPA
jgi:cyclopropane-fatty-acyl-phospholipid synthase